MIWFYVRGDESLTVETRFDNPTSSFELVWHQPDGTRTVEQFSTEDPFRARIEEVQAALSAERWLRSGPPQIQSDGWRT